MQLRLNNRQNARRSLARLTREFADAPVDDDPEVARLATDKYRALTYGLMTMLAFDKHADEMLISSRLAEIEKRLDEAERERAAP